MGNSENLDVPKSDPLSAERSSEQSSGQDQGGADRRSLESMTAPVNASEQSPPSSPDPHDRPAVRRSSLRPAPASFRPTTRDPALLRPAMVIHAGDTTPSDPNRSIPDPAPSHPSQVSLEPTAPLEPFALAEDLRPSSPHNALAAIESVAIPPPATIPRELRSHQPTRHKTLGGFAVVPTPARPAKSPAGDADGVSSAISAAATASVPPNTRTSNPDLATVQTSSIGASSASNHSTGLNRNVLVAFAASFVLVGVVVAALLGRSRPTEVPHTADVGAQPQTSSTASIEGEPATSAVVAAPSMSDEVAPEPRPEPPPEDSALTPPPNTTRVTLDVKPIDAKVYYRGVAQPGPPFVFDVAKGDKLAVELTRFGFVTRKVTIDDKKPVIYVGMVRAPVTKRAPQ